jgi:NAD(P)-dependent dehydrogenase (short-subunit alcohol dehydrogenase family)
MGTGGIFPAPMELRERTMRESTLEGKSVVVLGGSRGVGREIVRRAHAEKAHVLAVARGRDDLERLARELPGVRTLPMDASNEAAPRQVFTALHPDVLVVCGGATPAAAPLQELSWGEFTASWECDVRMSFLFCRHALRAPLSPGCAVILISSGAALGGSPISGGYAGAKRMQMFMAGYCQKESNRLGLGIRFNALAPLRIMPETGLGAAAVEGYARYLQVAPADFIQGMRDRQSARDVANAAIQLATEGPAGNSAVLAVSGQGVAPLP